MSPTSPLTIRAGATARRVLAERGFEPDAFSTLVGASGGPKWLVLRQLDELLAERFVAGRATPLTTLGSSIGSYRHACLARSDPRTALARFFEAYVGQRYEGPPSLDDVAGESARVLEHFLEEKGAEEVVSNPNVHTHIVASRLRGGEADAGLGFKLRIGASAAANSLGRGSLRHFYERALFGPEESRIAYTDLPTRHVRLTVENLRGALLASGAIPMLMRGVRDIPGAGGTWFDGGILDYDFEFEAPQGLLLFPHFFDRITPGWFDKALPWRKPRAAALDRVVMLAPSDAFVASLPGGKVPDRNDFRELGNDERIERWHAVDSACCVPAEDLVDLIDGNRWAARVLPFA